MAQNMIHLGIKKVCLIMATAGKLITGVSGGEHGMY